MTTFQYGDRIAILGFSTSGKSYLAKKIILAFKRTIVWDTTGEHQELGVVVTAPEQIQYYWERGVTNLVIEPEQEPDTGLFQSCMATVYSYLDNAMILVDEADLYADKNVILPEFATIVKRGAKKRLGYIAVARRSPELHNLVLSQAHYIIAFYHHHPNDIAFLKKWIPAPSNGSGDLEIDLKSLTGQYEHYFILYDKRMKTCLIQQPV